MASEYVQDFAFRQISEAIMATANSVASAGSGGSDGSSGESSIFDVVRRKWGKVQDVIQGIAAPLKRRSMYDELPEHVWPREQIEMSHIIQRGIGHSFVPCQLTNPTWCDYCGDFIWGLYKQCLRCQICQYTCHQHCLPAVNLNCKSVSEDACEVVAARTPSPSNPRASLESSLSMGNLQARPGCAKVVISGNQNTTDPTASGQSHGQIYSPKSPGPHLSRSASEGYVTAVSERVRDVSLPSHQSHRQHISSPQSSFSHQDIQPGSHQQTHIPSPVVEESGLSDMVAQGINSSSNNNISSDGDKTNLLSQPTETGGESSQLPDAHVQDGELHPEAATEKDETDSGYRSGTIPDDKLPRVPSQATLDRQELKRKIAKFNHFVPAASLEVTGKESFQGFLKVTMNLIRPITMELGARPPSIYELLTREHIIEENTQQVAFYMPRDTHKSLHITSDTTTREVVASLLKKFHILDHPRKFAMYEQEFSDRNKLVRLRRLADKDFPLTALMTWDPERIRNYRVVLQENETGEIVWDAFSLPELNNFLKVLDREEKETILELKHKYAYMKQYMERRLTELRNERNKKAKSKT